ncbi:DUF2207 domain-containing protein [Streptococcus vestibularis]|uniref:DUF2207 domain-containing protein n=1 Tax=Streptococcus vestibularis TaxID=1343 RepID=A0A564T676_STRVE|nr:DUF2207 domain-containing protein [Streptococcus vestibularis]VUX02599.1 Uncharacterised protein [Streptococcus vestibularis]
MKKILLFLIVILTILLPTTTVHAKEVRYDIASYKGHLIINDDGNGSFTQEVLYVFKSDYNGQYVTLGYADPVPKGFMISENPSVSATVNGQEKKDIQVEETNLSDGVKLKVYNSGSDGDKVQLKVTWQIKNMLSLYSDIAVLNWFPISDWDESINHVDFEVEGLDASNGELYAHTGYFGKTPDVERTSNGYRVQVEDLPSGGKLELHAYWPMTSALKDGHLSYISDEKYREKFIEKEASISKTMAAYQNAFYKILPKVMVGFFILGSFLFWRVLRWTKEPSFPYDVRIYETPQDLPPLVLAKSIYNQSFDKTGLGEENGHLKFKNMVQAVILDLVDRGYIAYSQENGVHTLRRISKEGLADYEFDFLEMLFDDRIEITDREMFSRYYLDEKGLRKQFNNAKSNYERDSVREEGQRIRRKFVKDGRSVTEGVNREVVSLGLPNLYRDFTIKENMFTTLGNVVFALLFIISTLVTIILFAGFGSGLGVIYLVVSLFLALVWYSNRKSIEKRRKRTLDSSHIEEYRHWQYFESMLRSITSFRQSELESVILWNRILVYATLYGQANKVSDVLKRYNIHLSNPSLDEFTHSATPFLLLNNVSRLESYVSTSDTVSNFSINSNSGSGGLGGGGFSGGGGGGGGGAF